MKQSDLAVRHSLRQKLFSVTAVIRFTLAPALSPAAYGQSASSAQAYYGSTQNGVTVADMFSPTLLFSGQLKTSNVGSILAGVYGMRALDLDKHDRYQRWRQELQQLTSECQSHRQC
jgi:hypothetical protein